MRIGVLCKKNYGAVEAYRLVPWIILSRQTGADLTLIEEERFTDYELAAIDVLVCHAPATKSHARAMLAAKSAGAKIIGDYDDLVFDIDTINPASSYWGAEETQFKAVELLMECDAVTVSTKALADEFKERFMIDAYVVNNALNDIAYPPWPRAQKPREKPLILWRGSNTHEGDIYSHREAFKPLRNGEYLFFGYNPAKLTKRYGGYLDSVPFERGVPWFPAYMQRLYQINPTYMVVPLEDTKFNRCKSNISLLEGTWANSTIVAPAYMPEFNQIPCILYSDAQELGDILQAIGRADDSIANLSADARKVVKERYLLSKINEQRVDILNQLLA